MDGNLALITRDFFTEEIITKLSQEEVGKRQYYRPIYSIHKWWARRPGALFRAMILMTATKGEKSLFDSQSEDSHDSYYYQDHDLSNLIVLDPFMGGGTTLVEANRLGAKVIGSDLNPVAYWVVRESLKSLDPLKLTQYFSELEKSVGEDIKGMYRTDSAVAPETVCDVLYTFWVRFIPCKHCHLPIYLFKRYFLNEGAKRNLGISKKNQAVVVCRDCHALIDFAGGKHATCPRCNAQFDPNEPAFNNGSCYCYHCQGKPFPLIEEVRRGSPLKDKMVAIEYYHPARKQRLYKSPDNKDLAHFAALESRLAADIDRVKIPKQEIPKGSSSARWRSHKFQYYSQVFNARQILAFNALMRGIENIPEAEYRNAFITAFSNSLEYNNMMTPYNYPHRKLHHLFTYHALPLTTTPVENAVWGAADEGAGTFANCFTRYLKAKEYCQRPHDKHKDAAGNIITVQAHAEYIGAHLVDSFSQLKMTSRSAWLRAGDSANLYGIPDKSVDAVITDPPYFDNIHYSELSNFFYVWLRLFDLGKEFEAEHVPVEQEAIVNVGQGKTEKDYYELLRSVFSESSRVLKDDGLVMFTFHHSKSQAWWTLLFALKDSGLYVDDYFPVTSEYKVNPHVRGKAALDVDLVIVCRKLLHTRRNGELEFGLVAENTKARLSCFNGSRPPQTQVPFYFIGETLKEASLLNFIEPTALENLMSAASLFTQEWGKTLLYTKAEHSWANLPLFSGIGNTFKERRTGINKKTRKIKKVARSRQKSK